VRERITAEVLREGRIEERVSAAVQGLRPAVKTAAAELPSEVARVLSAEPVAPWTAPVKQCAARLVESADQDSGAPLPSSRPGRSRARKSEAKDEPKRKTVSGPQTSDTKKA